MQQTTTPRKWHAAILDYDSDNSKDAPATTVTTSSPSATPVASTAIANYAAEIMTIKNELATLRTLITSAVDQIKTIITSHHAPSSSTSCDMETDATSPSSQGNPH